MLVERLENLNQQLTWSYKKKVKHWNTFSNYQGEEAWSGRKSHPFKTKRDEKGNVVRLKPRIVTEGFTQKFGKNYDEVSWKNVKTAYLNGVFEETFYMRGPEEYGWKQSARVWNR